MRDGVRSGARGRRFAGRAFAASVAVLAACSLAPGQGEGADPPEPRDASAGEAAIRFSFDRAPLRDVLSFFAREAGVPIVHEAEPPEGTVTFIDDEAYTLDEALRVLNVLLQTRGVLLRRDDRFLYLQELDNMKAEAVPTFTGGDLPPGVAAEDIVSVLVPLENAAASELAEQLSALVADYGAVVPLPRQNALILTETAAQCRRLMSIVAALDAEPAFEESVRVFALQHLRAAEALESLTVLVAEKQRTVVIDKDGKRRTIEEDDLAGVRMEADERTNSIIALGPDGRLTTVERLVNIIDVPASGGAGVPLTTFALQRVRPEDAVRVVRAMYAELGDATRPAVVALDEVGKVAVAGTAAEVDRVGRLLAEMEGSAGAGGLERDVLTTVRLERADAGAAIRGARDLLGPRHRDRVRMSPGAGGDAVLLAGPADAVEAAQRRISAVDAAAAGRPSPTTTVVLTARSSRVEQVRATFDRLLRRRAEDMASAGELARGDLGRIDVLADQRINALVVSIPGGLESAAREVFVSLDRPPAGGTETRVVALRHADAAPAARAVEQADRARRDAGGAPLSAVPAGGASNAVIVAGPADAVEDAAGLLAELDAAPAADGPGVRTIFLDHASAERLAPIVERLLRGERVSEWMRVQLMFRRMEPQDGADVRVAADERTNALIVTAPPAVLPVAEEIARQLDVPAERGTRAERAVRVIALANAEAQSVADTIGAVFADDGAAEPPLIRPDRASNSVIVRGTAAQLAEAQTLAEQLDGATAAPTRQVRTLRIDPSRGSAASIARTLGRLTANGAGPSVEVVSVEELLAAPDAAPPRAPAPDAEQPAGDVGGAEREGEGRARTTKVLLPKRVKLILRFTQTVLAASPAQGPDARAAEPGGPGDVTVAVDEATNTLVIVGSPRATERVAELARWLESELPAEPGRVRYIELPAGVDARGVTRTISQVARQLGQRSDQNPGGLTGRFAVTSDPSGGAVIVTANETDFAAVRPLLTAVTAAGGAELPVTTIKLARADAGEVASALQRFFDERGRAATGDRRAPRRVAISGDRRSSTLVVAAGDDELALVREIVETFDAPAEARDLRFEIIPLEHGTVSELLDPVRQLAGELQWMNSPWFSRGRSAGVQDRITIAPFVSGNAFVVMGTGESFDTIRSIVASLDTPSTDADASVAVLTLERIDPFVARAALRSAFGGGRRTWWDPGDPSEPTFEVDRAAGVVIAVAPKSRLAEIEAFVATLEEGAATRSRTVTRTVTLRSADAERAARSVSRFFSGRARALGEPNRVTVVGSRDGNAVLVTGPESDAAQAAEILVSLDAAPGGGPLEVRTFTLEAARASDVARTLNDALALRARGRRGADTRRFVDAAGGEVELVATVTADARSNTVVVTASGASMPIVAGLIERLDERPAVAEVELRVLPLTHAVAGDVAGVLSAILRRRGRAAAQVGASDVGNRLVVSAAPEDFDEIESIVAQLDLPADPGRTTEFVPLEFAQAGAVRDALGVFFGPRASEARTAGERDVAIVADESANALVISAGEAEWPAIRELLGTLDSERYDASRRLEVIALRHADAGALADAIQRAFDAPLRAEVERRRDQDRRAGRGGGRDEPPAVLVADDEVVAVSAEPVTNSLIVSASRDDLERIRAIVDRLDTPESARLAPPRIVRLDAGARAEDVARAIRSAYEPAGGRGANARTRTMTVVGDTAAGVLLVRADDDRFAEIEALAARLDAAFAEAAPAVRLLPVRGQPAARLAETVRRAFQDVAARRGEGLSVQADRAANALLITASAETFAEIEALVGQLEGGGDEPAGDAGHVPGVLVVPVAHSSPPRVIEALTALGVTRPQPADRPGVVGDPVRLVAMPTRAAVAVLGAPADTRAIERLIEMMDIAPADGQAAQELAIVPLESSAAPVLVETLRRLLAPAPNAAGTDVARALDEQLRRLNVRTDGLTDGPMIDLASPIRIEADAQTNSVIVAASGANVRAVRELIGMLDGLPAGDAVVVRIFHLENASASRVRGLLRSLFDAGEAVRRVPGVQVPTMPGTQTGRALASEVALEVDERTNALIVAGREEAAALVEVLLRELDAVHADAWVQPVLVPLEHADAATLAETIRRVVIEGAGDVPEASAMQRQVARLRVLGERRGPDGQRGAPGAVSDVFVPMSRLAVIPEEALNALIVLGTPANVRAVTRLAEMLDVEGASRFDAVRVYPLEHASADRVADLLRRLFRERVRSEGLREEDDVVIEPDVRSNALVVATSARSFDVLERLLTALDAPDAASTVGLHVVPVPGGDAEALAPKIERLMRDRLRALQADGQRSRDIVSVQADAASGSLIAAASAENLALIRELVGLLGERAATADAEAEVDLVSLGSAKAAEIVPLLEELYVRQANRDRGDGTVRVRADERLNAVVASGPAADLAQVRALIERLDTASPSAVREIRIIELRSANALEMVSLLENVLSGRSLAGTRADAARQATLLRLVRDRAAELVMPGDPGGGEPTETEVSAAIRERVSLTPDLRTNAIIASAPPAMMVLIEAMVEVLDGSASGAREIEVFHLQNADATNMAELLRDLFNLSQQGNLYVLVPTAPGAEGLSGGDRELAERLGLGDVTLTVVPDERQQLAITVDARTNSLLVSGTPQYLSVVSDVVAQLDAKPGTTREQFTVELKNARVTEVADSLQRFIDQEQDRLERSLGPDRAGSVLRQLEREISVVGVEGSSRLIVSVSPRYRETISTLIDELDRSPSQVQIQVLLAEVTLDTENTWGVDLTINPIGGRQYGGVYQAAGAGVLTAIGVPNLSVSSLDFELLVRALDVQGRLEVLSRPQILVNDNEEAQIQVGQEIQLVTNVERLDNGNTRSDVASRDVGVILDVRPSISPDGFVRLDISPEISSVSTQTTEISEDFQAPIIDVRRADTTVTVKDGQTIVIGGLIQNRVERRETKVPLLGDIPVLGLPFRSELARSEKTELLIILTPRVIRTNDDVDRERADRLTRDAFDRHTMREQIYEAIPRDDGPIFPSLPPDEEPVLLDPGAPPTGDGAPR